MSALKQKPNKTGSRGKTEHPVQPAKGDSDYAAMRKEIIAAFPKTLARLAE